MKSYIQRLIEKLRATEFLQGCQTCSSYEDGVQLCNYSLANAQGIQDA
jgi:hypothetical protein